MRVSGFIVVVAVLAACASAAPAEERQERGDARRSASEKQPRPLLIVMNKVIDGLGARLLAPPSAQGRRVSVKAGLLGVGPYDPRGEANLGIASPPLHLFPQVGLGNSLGVDPNTGRSYWTHLP